MDNYKLSLPLEDQETIDPAIVKARYENPESWQPLDNWHILTSKKIEIAIKQFLGHMPLSTLVALNLGSGGVDYGIICKHHVHLDIVPRRLRGLTYPVAATANCLPLRDQIADLVLCVGGVFNYIDLSKAIPEISRTLKPKGLLVLEFESSRSFEFSWSIFGKPCPIVNTFYNYKAERLRVYSEEFVVDALVQAGFAVEETQTFHILSSMAYRFSKNENTAYRWASLDSIARLVPGLRRCGSNLIMLAQKNF